MGWVGPVTHRQFTTWRVWQRLEMDNPSRADYYVMALTTVVKQILAKNPSSIKLKDARLKFTSDADQPVTQSPSSQEYVAELAKAAWALRLGKPTVRKAKRDNDNGR